VDKGSPRPFGNVFLDGWDIDLESQGGSGSPNSYKYLGSMLNHLRGYFARDTSHAYHIAGAPQCPLPESNMGLSMTQAKYDYLWIQFYNNNCAANDLFRDSNENPNGAGYFNLKDWPKYLGNGASKNAKLLVGLPGASDAAENYDFVASKNLASLVSQAQNVPNFAGVMIYDAGAVSESSTNGKDYAQLVKDALNNA
jgi:chitinase